MIQRGRFHCIGPSQATAFVNARGYDKAKEYGKHQYEESGNKDDKCSESLNHSDWKAHKRPPARLLGHSIIYLGIQNIA
jgi:hypothetical protein